MNFMDLFPTFVLYVASVEARVGKLDRCSSLSCGGLVARNRIQDLHVVGQKLQRGRDFVVGAGLLPDTQSDSGSDTFAGFKVIRCGG